MKIYCSYFSDFSNLDKHEFGPYWRCWVPIKRRCEERFQVCPVVSRGFVIGGRKVCTMSIICDWQGGLTTVWEDLSSTYFVIFQSSFKGPFFTFSKCEFKLIVSFVLWLNLISTSHLASSNPHSPQNQNQENMLEDINRLDEINYQDYPDVWDPEPRVDRDVVSGPSGLAGAPDIEWSRHHRVVRPQQYRDPYYYHQHQIANKNDVADRRQASVLSGGIRIRNRQEAFIMEISGMGRILPLLVALPVMAAASYYLGTVKVLH